MTKVIKRDGSKVDYNLEKIAIAISGAFDEIDGVFDDVSVLDDIEQDIFKHDEISVEDIQDIVEEKLWKHDYMTEARKYMRYRYNHELARNKKQQEKIAQKIECKNIENQNANVDEKSFGGRKGEAANIVMKDYALENIVSEMARKNHENNEIYIHDLDSYAVGQHNCLSIPFDDLLAKGFKTRQTDVRPANSVNTAFQLLAVIFQLQSLQQFGGVSATHLDWTMVPYVRKSFTKHFRDGLTYCENKSEKEIEKIINYFKDNYNSEVLFFDNLEAKESYPKAWNYAMEMTKRETYQAVEGMYHNLNTLQSRSGNQLPFTSINYGTCTLEEGRLVTKAILDVSITGLGKLHRTSIFPCGIFQCMKNVNRKPGDPNYDLFRLALKSTAQRLYPNYANVDWSGNSGYDINDPRTYFSTMGKRKLSSCKIFWTAPAGVHIKWANG